jgi:hypothetical protein
LGHSADHPIYIETLPRRGYRFLAPVEGDRPVQPAANTATPRRRMLRWLAAGGLVIVLATGLWPVDVPQVEKVVLLTNDTTFKNEPVWRQLLLPVNDNYFYRSTTTTILTNF